MTSPSSMSDEEAPLVVLIHGFAAGRLSMHVIGRMLRTRGFRVEYWGYPSLFQPIENHAVRLREYLTDSLSNERKIHIVAHSMGSIVTRGAVSDGAIPNLGRMVFLAPPNQGLLKARVASKIMGRIFRPLADLSSRSDSYVNSLPPLPHVEIGVIAAKYDLLIPVRRTHLEGENFDADPSLRDCATLIDADANLQGCAALNVRSSVHGGVGINNTRSAVNGGVAIKKFHTAIRANHISILFSRRAANLIASFI